MAAIGKTGRVQTPPSAKIPKELNPKKKENSVSVASLGGGYLGAKIDSQDIAEIIKNMPQGPSAPYFSGAPEWSESAKKRLFGFIVSALGKNELFKDRPLATEETAGKVCEAITNSPQLTAKFLPYLSKKQ